MVRISLLLLGCTLTCIVHAEIAWIDLKESDVTISPKPKMLVRKDPDAITDERGAIHYQLSAYRVEPPVDVLVITPETMACPSPYSALRHMLDALKAADLEAYKASFTPESATALSRLLANPDAVKEIRAQFATMQSVNAKLFVEKEGLLFGFFEMRCETRRPGIVPFVFKQVGSSWLLEFHQSKPDGDQWLFNVLQGLQQDALVLQPR